MKSCDFEKLVNRIAEDGWELTDGTKKQTPKSKTPKEMKNPRTHNTAKINQLKKAISKAKNNEEDATARVLKHRGALETSKEKVSRLNQGRPSFRLASETGRRDRDRHASNRSNRRGRMSPAFGIRIWARVIFSRSDWLANSS